MRFSLKPLVRLVGIKRRGNKILKNNMHIGLLVIYMVYVNKYWVTYRKEEFYIELKLEGPDKEEKIGEIYTTPRQAKTLMRILEVLIKEYEDLFEKLPEPQIIREEEGKKEYKPSFYVA